MQRFNFGALDAWKQIGLGEFVAFHAPRAGTTTVTAKFMSDAPICVRAVLADYAAPVAVADGLFEVSFTANGPVNLVCEAIMPDEDTEPAIFMLTNLSHVVRPPSGEPAYTSIEPRGVGPSDDVRKMMLIARQNSLLMQRQLDQEREAWRRERDEFRTAMEQREAARTDSGRPNPEPRNTQGEGGSSDE